MEENIWKLGDACFITVIEVNTAYPRFAVMPAVVNHIGGTAGTTATALSLNPPAMVGPFFAHGTPYRTEAEARSTIAAFVERIVAASKTVPLLGTAPETKEWPTVPRNGEVVYLIDPEAREILEVTVGFVKLEGGLELGYDPSPTNGETSMVRIDEYWRTKEETLHAAVSRHGPCFSFVPKAEVARRADQEVENLWARAKQNFDDPQFQENQRAFFERLFTTGR